MRPSEIHATLVEFLGFVERRAPGDDRGQLVRLLDRLALTSHGGARRGASRAAELTDLEAPRGDYGQLRARIAKRFPDLGLYVSSSTDLEGELLVADAIDDLTDIVLDLGDVVWLWEQAGEADALWALDHGFASHWGAHLRGLQAYLHELGAER